MKLQASSIEVSSETEGEKYLRCVRRKTLSYQKRVNTKAINRNIKIPQHQKCSAREYLKCRISSEKMSGVEINPDSHPLLIIEKDIRANFSDSDNSEDNESSGELFDFSSSDVRELGEGARRNSLLIVEEKDLEMNASEDQNNNSSVNYPRLSLNVDSDDESSSGLTNEAINRTFIRIGSSDSSGDFGEGERSTEKPREAINHELDDIARENYPDDDEGIVNILGQIDILVGCKTDALNVSVSCCGISVERGLTW